MALAKTALAACVAFGALAVAVPGRAETAVQDPMLRQNPMTPNPGAPMSPLSISPMQPLGGLAGKPAPGVARDPEFDNLPIAPGMEETFYSCTACHSSQTFQQMRLTDARWEYLWDWMIREQGMIDYGEETRTAVLGYLKQHFSSER